MLYMRWSNATCDSLQISLKCVRACVQYQSVHSVGEYVWLYLFTYGVLVRLAKGGQFCRICHSRVSLSVLLSAVCCDWSELEITNSSFLSASSSVPPLARAPWMAFLSSFLSCRPSRMKPGMQIINEIVRRLRVRPRYAILRRWDAEKNTYMAFRPRRTWCWCWCWC